jgi:hypothetical protein
MARPGGDLIVKTHPNLPGSERVSSSLGTKVSLSVANEN